MADEPTIADLIARKRAAGHDQEFEDTLARPWRCPHCRHETTILLVLIPTTPDAEISCPACGKEGIKPVEERLQ